MFSATYTNKVIGLVEEFLRNDHVIKLKDKHKEENLVHSVGLSGIPVEIGGITPIFLNPDPDSSDPEPEIYTVYSRIITLGNYCFDLQREGVIIREEVLSRFRF